MLKLLVIAALCTSSDAITPPKSKLSAPKTVHRGGGAMTETQATVSLFKTIVGGGILALPAGASAYTYSLVGRSVTKTRAKTFSELWAAAFGKQTSWIIDLIIVGVAGGAALTYSCFTGDLLRQLSGVERTRAIL